MPSFQLFSSSLRKFIRNILTIFFNHTNVLFYDFDPIKDVGSKRVKRNANSEWKVFNRNFVLPYLLVIFFYTDSLYAFYKANFKYDCNSIQLYTHTILPREFWFHGDVMIHVGMSMQVAIYTNLLFQPLLHKRYWMVASADNNAKTVQIIDSKQVWTEENSLKMSKYRQKELFGMRLNLILAVFQFESFHMWLFVCNWNNSFKNYLLTLLLPLFLVYTTFAIAYFVCYFKLTSGYIRVKQQFILGKLKRLTDKLVYTFESTARSNATEYLQLWRSLRSINQEMLQLFDEIRAHNRFWSRYLTIYFAGYIVMICFLAYSHFFVSSAIEWYYRTFFIFFAAQFTATLFSITYSCSQVVHYNLQIHKQNYKFCLLFRMRGQTKTGDCLKIDNIEANRKAIYQIGFNLLDGYQINSKMFEMLFYYISTLFLLILQEK